ncbi:MAG: hypothetical protein RMI91_04425 [Gemmatales bacterium]|nr:hypothetical protein [Gemmatales bacterium]MDW7993881.1 hypothetical protein [Gemmatales bacterium]
MLDPQLLKILVCPLGKAPLRLEGNTLVCTRCGPRFSISRDGLPNMLIEEAELPPGIQRLEDLPCYRETLKPAESP